MPMHNLLKYIKNDRKTTGSLWNYFRDQPSNSLSGDLNLLNTKLVLQEKHQKAMIH